MNQESKYRVVLLDKDECELGECQADGLKGAKAEMRRMLSDDYAKAAETTHERMGTYKAEVRNATAECVADAFL